MAPSQVNLGMNLRSAEGRDIEITLRALQQLHPSDVLGVCTAVLLDAADRNPDALRRVLNTTVERPSLSGRGMHRVRFIDILAHFAK